MKLLTVFLLSLGLWFPQNAPFSREQFYDALSSTNLALINQQFELLKQLTSNELTAFTGTLMMKKAALITNPKERLNEFKNGRLKLEAIILKDTSNVEFRFMRLIIQENAPKFLGYNGDIPKDSYFIRQKINNINVVLRKIILNYNTTSKALKLPNVKL
jgi:hypothetical protein